MFSLLILQLTNVNLSFTKYHLAILFEILILVFKD